MIKKGEEKKGLHKSLLDLGLFYICIFFQRLLLFLSFFGLFLFAVSSCSAL